MDYAGLVGAYWSGATLETLGWWWVDERGERRDLPAVVGDARTWATWSEVA